MSTSVFADLGIERKARTPSAMCSTLATTAAACRPVTKAVFAFSTITGARLGSWSVSSRVGARSGPWSRKNRAAREPRIAMPSALPISLLVSASAPADPARSAGTAPTAVSATTAKEIPQPRPATTVEAMYQPIPPVIVALSNNSIARSGQKVFGTSDIVAIFHRLRFDKKLRWRDGNEILDVGRIAVAKAEGLAPSWFTVVPNRRCAVEAVPPEQDAAIPSGMYLTSSPDGKRPGTYFTNITRPTERFRYFAEVLAFHEAVPGHHFQVTRAQGLSHLPMLRRLPLSTAYVEGWALYTERLADEMGLYSDELSRMGMLVSDVLRAVRLVVDTGLHAKGWSRAEAVEYVRTNTVLPDLEVEAEVNRFIGYPGQALAYMVGRLEINRIRAAAQHSLGDRFDIRTFHDTVLREGALPLAVLADVVTDWVKNA